MQISTWLWNWLDSRRHRRSPETPLDHAARLTLRKLEERQVLSVTPTFIVPTGTLDIDVDGIAGDSNVTVTVDGATGDVLVNGNAVDLGGGINLTVLGK